MNVIFLTAIVFTVALVHGAQEEFRSDNQPTTDDLEDPHFMKLPCQAKSAPGRYKDFVKKHILKEKVNSPKEWERYLTKKGLCGRVPVQSFIYADQGQVDQVCRGGGSRVSGATGSKGNLCISDSAMTVYDVTSQRKGSKCKVSSAKRRSQKVVVACDKVKNKCLPVHYEKYRGQQPDTQQCS